MGGTGSPVEAHCAYFHHSWRTVRGPKFKFVFIVYFPKGVTGVGGEDREERRFETYNIRGRTASPVEADCAHSRKQRPSVRGPKFNFVLKIDRFVRNQPFMKCLCQGVKFRGRLKRGVNGYDSEARRVRVRHMTIGIYGIIAGIK